MSSLPRAPQPPGSIIESAPVLYKKEQASKPAPATYDPNRAFNPVGAASSSSNQPIKPMVRLFLLSFMNDSSLSGTPV
jgi:hypothetical protein